MGLSAQETVQRLLEAERQARSMVDAAEQQAAQTLSEAKAQAETDVRAAEDRAEQERQVRLEDAKAEAERGVRERLDRAEAEIQELETRAERGMTSAVQVVVGWVTGTEDS